MNKVEVVIMIVDPLSGGHNGNSEDHLPLSVKFLLNKRGKINDKTMTSEELKI